MCLRCIIMVFYNRCDLHTFSMKEIHLSWFFLLASELRHKTRHCDSLVQYSSFNFSTVNTWNCFLKKMTSFCSYNLSWICLCSDYAINHCLCHQSKNRLIQMDYFSICPSVHHSFCVSLLQQVTDMFLRTLLFFFFMWIHSYTFF